MSQSGNPWVDRFASIATIDAIRKKTRLRVKPLHGLETNMVEEAADRIKDAWEATFYPTDRACQILLDVVQSAASHAARHHPDYKTHLARSYQKEIDIEPYVPMLLWGPAGTGKSELGKALLRLFPEASSVKFPAGHGPMPLVAIRVVKAQGKNSVASIIRPLAPDSAAKIKTSDLYELCARYQYICGVSCILVDELQFFTQSSSANTLLTQLLLGLSYVKVPYLVIANYSLGHRLKRRNSEELQRLLGRPIVLLPDGPETSDWLEVVEEYQRVVPGIFEFSFNKLATALWSLCAGLKRILVRLLILAYRKVRQSGRLQASWVDVEKAYSSMEFAVYRADVEILVLHGIASPALREDLRCPFPIDRSDAEKYHAALRASREEKLAEAAFRASINLAEQKAVDFIKEAFGGAMQSGSDTRFKLPKSKPKKKTAESIKDAGERFRQRI